MFYSNVMLNFLPTVLYVDFFIKFKLVKPKHLFAYKK